VAVWVLVDFEIRTTQAKKKPRHCPKQSRLTLQVEIASGQSMRRIPMAL
jgi:hypothetical protein